MTKHSIDLLSLVKHHSLTHNDETELNNTGTIFVTS